MSSSATGWARWLRSWSWRSRPPCTTGDGGCSPGSEVRSRPDPSAQLVYLIRVLRCAVARRTIGRPMSSFASRRYTSRSVIPSDRDTEARLMDYTLELIVVPVSDVDRAKAFYIEQAGFDLL